MSTGCRICDDKVMRRVVDDELAKGAKYAALSRLMGMRGYPVSANIITRHKKERHQYDYDPSLGPSVAPAGRGPEGQAPKQITKRDATQVIKDRLLDALEADPDIDILDKHIQPALNTALKAQAIEDKREQKKVQVNFWVDLFTEQQQPKLIESPDVIEGHAVEIE